MSRQFLVQATITSHVRGGVTCVGVQVPTFFLNAGVQGIRSVSHAAKIARGVVDPLSVLEVSIYVTEMGGSENFTGQFPPEEQR